MFDDLESVGEEEGEGGNDGCGTFVEAACSVAGYVDDGFGSCGVCHVFM